VRLGNGEGKSGGDMWDLEYVEGVKGRKSEVMREALIYM
jgi:hypothetical protein